MDTTNLKAFLSFDNSPTDDFCGNSWTTSGNPTVSDGQLYLDGSSYLQMDNPFVFSGQDFTISVEVDFKVNPSSSNSKETCIWQLYGGNNYRIQLEFYGDGRIWLWGNGDNVNISTSLTLDNQKHHIEVGYSNSVWYLFVDGQLIGTDTYNLPSGNLPLYVGINNRDSGKIKGYFDNFTFYDGVILHTQNFTPSSEGVIQITENFDTLRKIKSASPLGLKVWLQFNNDTTFDFCGNSWTASNNPSISRTNSFYGGALNLNGGVARTAPYITLDEDITLGGQDFTIDFWCYADSSLDSTYDYLSDFFGFFNYNGVYTSKTFLLCRSAGTVNCIFDGSSPIATFNIPLDTLFYFAIVYTHSNSTWRFFINGSLVATGVKTFPATTYKSFRLGVANYLYNNRLGFKGTIDEFRIFDSVALWTEDFSLPTVSDYLGYLDYIDYEGYSAFPLAIRLDTEKHVNKSIQFQLDTLRDLPFILKLDTDREIQKSVAPFLDTSRKIKNNFAFSFDTIRKNAVPVQFQLDTLRDLPLIFRLDTKLRIKNIVSFNLDTSRFSGNVLDFLADFDTSRNIINATDFSADTKLQIIQSVELDFDAERIVERSVNFDCDIIRKLPYPFIIEPTYNLLPIDTPVTAGIQSLSIDISAGQLVDQFNFVTVNKIDILEQVKGQYLDYKFNFRVERISERDVFTDLPINSCQCCSDIDKLLYTQIAYKLKKENWNGGLYTKSKNNDEDEDIPTPTGNQIIKKYRTETEVEAKTVFASSHVSATAGRLGLTPVLLFDNFQSTVEIEQEGVTYQDILSEVFGWSTRVPHKQINYYIRDEYLFVVQRGHEQNTFDLSTANIGKDVTIDKSLVRTSFGVTRETTADLYRRGGLNSDGYWEPVLGNPLPEEDGEGKEPARRKVVYTKQVQGGGESYSESVYSDGYKESSSATETNGDSDSKTVTTTTYYSYDDDDNVESTVTTTKGGDVDTMVVTKNSYSSGKGEKRLTTESITEYEWRGGSWAEVNHKVTTHSFSGGKQQFTSSTDNDGNIVGSGTTSASRDDRYSAYDDAQNSNYLQGNLLGGTYTVEQDGVIFTGYSNPQLATYTYENGQKIEVVGHIWRPAEYDIETGTLEEVKLYDSSFPVDKSKAMSITNDLRWLNRKIQETVSLDVYDFPHVFDLNDKIIFRGNTYHLQSNSVTHSYNIINKQSLQLIRWCNQDGTTATATAASWQSWVLVSKVKK